MDAVNADAPAVATGSGVVAGDPKQRQRFYVELTPGETTIVSWKRLVQEANNEVVSDDSSDENSEDYTQVEKSRIKESGSFVRRDKVQHKTCRKNSSKSSNVRTRKRRKEIMASVTSAAHQKLQEKKSAHHDLHSRSSMSKNNEQEGFTNIKQRNKKGRNELPDLNLPYTGHAPVFMETPTESLSSASLLIHQIPPHCQPVGPISSTKL